MRRQEAIYTVVIRGGQSGLSVGYHLQQRGIPFVILDAAPRTGDAWRHRWDSLRLFTPARIDGLDGLAFPAAPNYYPTKDEMADYLEVYVRHFDLPVRLGVRVDRLTRVGERFMVAAGDRVVAADNVVVAMSAWQYSKRPPFAAELAPDIFQIHSRDYRRPAQLPEGDALVVGAGNSGAEIALELSASRRVGLAGRHPGSEPFDVDGWFGSTVGARLMEFILHRVLTRDTALGRKVIATYFGKGASVVRAKPRQLAAAGVSRVDPITHSRNGLPATADGSTFDVASVIWACGYDPGLEWIDLDILDANVLPRHRLGIVDEAPGLYFVGQPFQYSISSHTIFGVGRDAARVVEAIVARSEAPVGVG